MSRTVVREEVIAAEPVEAMAGLLDLAVPADGLVPALWHWLYLLQRPATRDLGLDGHPTAGIPSPPGPQMRRMFGGGRVDTWHQLRIGEPAVRTTTIVNEVEKHGRSGPLHVLTVHDEISQHGRIVIVEEQDIIYRDRGSGSLPPEQGAGLPDGREATLALDVDEPMLFRFSALTYNAHRIHYDRDWCRREGYDDLVVHGPLQALMMAELARRNHVPLVGRRFDYRLVSPFIGPQRMHVFSVPDGPAQGAEVCTATGRLTAYSALSML